MQSLQKELPQSGESFQIHIQYTNAKKPFTEPHVHDFIEILYCIHGTYNVVIEEKHTLFSEGMLIVINSGSVHSVKPHGDPNGEYLVIKLLPDMIYSSYQSAIELKYALPFIYGQSKKRYIFSKDETEQSDIYHCLKSIVTELLGQKYGYEIALKADIYRLIVWLLRNTENYSDYNEISDIATRKIADVLAFIDNNYSSDLNVKQLSKSANLEYCYFSRLFKQVTGRSCSEYINRVRVLKAKNMLLSKNISVTEIGTRCGYENTSYFIKQFKRFNGVTPKQYISNLK